MAARPRHALSTATGSLRRTGCRTRARVTAPALPGMIFSLGGSRMSTDLVRGTTPRFVEFGNYQYTVKSRQELDHLPLGLCRGEARRAAAQYRARRQGQQRIRIEPAGVVPEASSGCRSRATSTSTSPSTAPRDTSETRCICSRPDIMARFIDNAAELDVEIVDDWMFLYTQRRVSTLDPATWAWLFGAVGALDHEARSMGTMERRASAPRESDGCGIRVSRPPHRRGLQASGFRLPPPCRPAVAAAGRRAAKDVRLKRSFPWVPVVFMIAFAAFWFWSRSF